MPQFHAVVVGTDATALHVGGQLAARGFQVTLLEATQAIGGQWVHRLFADNVEPDFNAAADGVFVDFPFLLPRPANSSADFRHSCGGFAGLEVNDESIGPVGPGSILNKIPWAEPSTKPLPAAGPQSALPKDQQLLRHLSDYAQAAGLHRSVRLGCTLRRAKWQAMNGCWRLELKTESQVQRGGSQLSADLLVVSRMAVAAARLPQVPGTELYCGTILTANDQLSGPGGAAVLEQQLRGRNVLVVGPAGPAAAGWAEACRHHAGCGGSVVLLELDEGAEGTARGAAAPDDGGGSSGCGGGPLSRLFGACFGGGGGRSHRRQGDAARLDRFSPAQAPLCQGGGGGGSGGGAGESLVASGGLLLTPERGSGTSGTLDDAEGEVETEEAGPDLDPHLAKVGRLEGESTTAPVSGVGGEGEDEGEGEEGSRKRHDGGGGGGGGKKAPPEGGGGAGGGGGGGRGGKLATGHGHSSLRVLRGVSALLNGTHVMLSTGEELPAEVVLLVPLGGEETSLAFLDAGAPLRVSQAGGSSVGGSFRRAGTSLAAASASLASMAEPLTRQLDALYRDVVSSSPFAPNFALVGAGTGACQHDARTAAVQAAWLLAMWVALDEAAAGGDGAAAGAADGPAGHHHFGGAGGIGGGGAMELGWAAAGVQAGGFLRQASPMEAAADAGLRARWKREAARRGRPDLYRFRYLQQLLTDLGRPLQVPSKWPRCVGGPAPVPEQLTRQRVAKLLGLKRLRRPQSSTEETISQRGGSPRASPSRARGYSCNGGPFAGKYGAAAASAAAAAAGYLDRDRGSGPASREASRTSYQGGFPLRHSNSASQALALRERALGPRGGGGFAAAVASGGSFFEPPARSEGSFPALAFSSQQSRAPSAGCLPSQGQLAEAGLSTASLLANPHPLNLSNGNMGNLGGNPSLSFGLGSNQLVLSHELQLYRVAEHPAENLGDSGAGVGAAAAAAAAGDRSIGRDRGVGALLPPPPLMLQSQLSQPHPHPHSQQQLQSILPSCPSSPSMAQAAAMYTSAGSISGSIGSVRSRLLVTNGGTSFSTVAPAPSGGGGGAGSVATSPCVLAGSYGGGAETAGAPATAPAMGVVPGTTPALCGEDLQGMPGGSQQQRLRSQLLQRHRSTSRLAGVSNASSGPTASQAQTGGTTSGTLTTLIFGRRTPAVSTSQVSLDIPQSFLTERRSHSGRPSNGSVRRGNNMSTGGGSGGAGNCSPGTNGLLGRANSAVRLQLLLAAASSASRRRTAMTPASPASSDAYSPVSVPHPGGEPRHPLQKAYSEALQPINAAPERATYGNNRYSGGAAAGRIGGRTSGMGTSIAAIARAARVSGGAANPHGSVSEPVAGDLGGSAPLSPSRRDVYGKLGETISAHLPGDAEVMAAAAASGHISGASASGDYATGQQQWLDGDAGDGAACDTSGSISGSRGGSHQPVGRRRTRRRSITLPDLRLGGVGQLQQLQEYAEQYLAEDERGAGGEGDGGPAY